MAEVLPVSRTQPDRVGRVSLRLIAARIIAQIAPRPAASVGVAVPVAMDPSTVRISASGAKRSRSSASANDPSARTFVETGAYAGLVSATKTI